MNLATGRMISWAALACAAWWAALGSAQAQTPTQNNDADTAMSHSSAQSEAGEPRAGADKGEPRPGSDSGAKADGGRRAGGSKTTVDKLQLQTATVTGDREQPKVMYIVPWKRSDIGDLSGKPMNSLLDEALAPVDRDEFKREVMYYRAIRAEGAPGGAAARGAAAPGPQGK